MLKRASEICDTNRPCSRCTQQRAAHLCYGDEVEPNQNLFRIERTNDTLSSQEHSVPVAPITSSLNASSSVVTHSPAPDLEFITSTTSNGQPADSSSQYSKNNTQVQLFSLFSYKFHKIF